MSTFLITSTGRTGTMFLANAMNRSAYWNVEHEPPTSHNDNIKEKTRVGNERFAKQKGYNYGEVNSVMGEVVSEIKVDKYGIIFRNIYDTILSMLNRKRFFDREHKWDRKFAQFIRLADRERSNLIIISFSKMTTDLSYFNFIVSQFVHGIRFEEISPVMHSSPKIYLTIDAAIKDRIITYGKVCDMIMKYTDCMECIIRTAGANINDFEKELKRTQPTLRE